MKKTYYTLCIIIFLCIGIKANEINSNEFSVTMLSNSTKFNYKEIKNLIVYGDSHSATGTNYTDMSYTGKNASHGKNWPLWLKNFNNMKLWNYAKSCAVVNKNLVNIDSCVSLDFKGEYKLFFENMSEGKKFSNQWESNNSLFAIFIGNRDVGLMKNKNITEEIDNIIDDLYDTINDMYKIGARNILIMEAYPRHKFPASLYHPPRNKEFFDYLKRIVLIFNNEIENKGKLFFNKHLDTNIFIYKTVDLFEEIISNCSKYNFKDCVHAWVKNKNESINDYFWVNSHISDPGNKILAEDINNLLNSINNE